MDGWTGLTERGEVRLGTEIGRQATDRQTDSWSKTEASTASYLKHIHPRHLEQMKRREIGNEQPFPREKQYTREHTAHSPPQERPLPSAVTRSGWQSSSSSSSARRLARSSLRPRRQRTTISFSLRESPLFCRASPSELRSFSGVSL